MRTIILVCLLILLTQLTDVHSKEIFVKAGDMLALHCPNIRNMANMEIKPTWISYTPHKINLTSSKNSSSLLLHKKSLNFLTVSTNQEGKYSCSMGNRTFWFKVSVYSTLSGDQSRVQYSTTCYTEDSCTLHCPVSNTPGPNIPNMTRSGITWTKDGQMFFKDVLSFSNVEPRDHGVYICTRSYLYHGQTYNISFTNMLTVKPKETLPDVRIISPHNRDVFKVDIGSVFVVNCTAVIYSEFDEVFWLIEDSLVDTDNNSRVFYNSTLVKYKDETNMTVSLIFKEVLEKDLTKNYRCKLESVAVTSSFVTISLTQGLRKKNHLSSLFLILGIVAIILVIAVTVLSLIKFKMEITRHRKSSDGKAYDAYLMCYKSKSDNVLSEDDTRWLEDVLEKDFGYDLCLHHSSVPAEETVEEDVLQCIQQSRAVILVPSVSNSGADCGLVTDLTVLEKHNTRLIGIQTETEGLSKSSSNEDRSLLEAFPLLGKPELRTVTWKGKSSRQPSSSFCKELRYNLSPPQHNREHRVIEIL